LAPVGKVVPVGDQVSEGASLMAEGDAAVHAARRLALELLGRPGEHDLLPVLEPLLDGPVGLLVTLELDEPGNLPHLLRPEAACDDPHAPARAAPCWTRVWTIVATIPTRAVAETRAALGR